MTIVDVLLRLGAGSCPTEFNPTPAGLSPITRFHGFKALKSWEPQTEAERRLLETAEPMFRKKFTPEQHREYRKALFVAYQEQGFGWDELAEFFPDMETK